MALVLRQPKRIYRRLPRRLPLIDQYPLYAVALDGSSGYLTVPNSPSLRGFTELTIMCWLKPGPYTGATRYLFDGGYWTAQGGLLAWLFDTSNHIRFYLKNTAGETTGIDPAIPFTPNKWNAVGMVWDGATARHIHNGKLIGTGSISGTVDPTQDLFVGCKADLTSFCDTSIALLLIYNRELSLYEIQRNIYNPLAPVRDGLVLFLPMLEGSGTSVADYSGQGNNGTLHGGVSWVELAKYEIPAGAGL